MNQRRPDQTKTFITLSSKVKRENSLPYIFPPHPKCSISLLSPQELTGLLQFLSLLDLVRFHQALYCHNKTKEGAKTVISYIARSNRIYSTLQLKDFLEFIILKKRRLKKWWGGDRSISRNDLQRISWDVQRTNVWFCTSKEQIVKMREYLNKVLVYLCGEESKYGYIQGFHCIIKAMFQCHFSENEAIMLGGYFLKEMKLGRYYENRQQKIRQLCYVVDVYVFNNAPEVHLCLKKIELNAQCYALGWLLTLFSNGLPLAIVTRLWILFILKGWKVIIKFTVALLCLFQVEILKKSESSLPEYLGSLLSKITFHQHQTLWQLYSSIKVTNQMVFYLSKNMKSLEYDRQISLLQLKKMRETNINYGQLEANQFPTYLSVGCCERVEPTPMFPFCTN